MESYGLWLYETAGQRVKVMDRQKMRICLPSGEENTACNARAEFLKLSSFKMCVLQFLAFPSRHCENLGFWKDLKGRGGEEVGGLPRGQQAEEGTRKSKKQEPRQGKEVACSGNAKTQEDKGS